MGALRFLALTSAQPAAFRTAPERRIRRRNEPIGLYAVADSGASQGAYGLVAETDKATSLFATSNTQDTFATLVDINKNMI